MPHLKDRLPEINILHTPAGVVVQAKGWLPVLIVGLALLLAIALPGLR